MRHGAHQFCQRLGGDRLDADAHGTSSLLQIPRPGIVARLGHPQLQQPLGRLVDDGADGMEAIDEIAFGVTPRRSARGGPPAPPAPPPRLPRLDRPPPPPLPPPALPPPLPPPARREP